MQKLPVMWSVTGLINSSQFMYQNNRNMNLPILPLCIQLERLRSMTIPLYWRKFSTCLAVPVSHSNRMYSSWACWMSVRGMSTVVMLCSGGRLNCFNLPALCNNGIVNTPEMNTSTHVVIWIIIPLRHVAMILVYRLYEGSHVVIWIMIPVSFSHDFSMGSNESKIRAVIIALVPWILGRDFWRSCHDITCC